MIESEKLLALKVFMCFNNLLYIFIVLFDKKYLFKSYYPFAGLNRSIISIYNEEVKSLIINKYYLICLLLNILFSITIFNNSNLSDLFIIIFSSIISLLLSTYLFVLIKYITIQNIKKDNNLIMGFHFILAIIMAENFFPIVKEYSILTSFFKISYFYFLESTSYNIFSFLFYLIIYSIILKIYLKWYQLSKHYI